jgi:hypothetical protein
MSPEAAIPTFVMPHFGDDPESGRYFRRAFAGILAQSDSCWRLVVVDDATSRVDARDAVREIARAYPDRVVVLERPVNVGQGICRNIGVSWAARHEAPFVLFHDADDVSHPRRVGATRRVFDTRPEIDSVYSTFVVIDEHDEPVPVPHLTPSIAEILASHEAPIEGPDAWIQIGTEAGYTTLTSTVSVRTAVAYAHPFPPVRGSEDGHTWLRMSAGGANFAYVDGIPSRYRIPQHTGGSSDRARIGANYYLQKAIVDMDGFRQAIRLALGRGVLDQAEAAGIVARFNQRLSATLEAEGFYGLAQDIMAGRTPELNVLGSALPRRPIDTVSS